MTDRPLTGKCWRLVTLVLAGCGLLAGVGGCENGAERISLAELYAREQGLQAQADVSVEPQQLALTDYQPYQLQIGDVLLVQMTGLGESPYDATGVQVRIHEDGTISLPLVGRVAVAGLTLAQAEAALIDAHVPAVATDLAVFVQLAQQGGTSVLVLGAAAAPGLVSLDTNERNILYAMQQVGGFNPSATGRLRMKPIRPERPEVVYNFNDINDVRRALLAPPLESGDMIVVEASPPHAVYVTGLVNAPGAIAIPPGSEISALQAIATAGGTQPYLDVKEATLIRELPDGETVHVKVDLEALQDGKAPDIALASGDILELPHTPDTLFQEWFVRNVLVGPFSVGVRYDPLAQYNANRAIDADRGDNDFSDAIRRAIGTTIPEAFIPPPQAP